MKKLIKKYLKVLLDKKYRRFVSNIVGVANIFPLFKSLIRSRKNIGDRVLIVYDLSVQPFSVGDLLLAQEVGQILCLEKAAKFVDLAIVLDPGKPTSNDPAFNSINSGNYLFNFSALFPIVQFNKNIGSVFVFNCSSQLTRYIRNHQDYKMVWPSIKDIFITKRYLHYIAFDEVIYPHCQIFKRPPSLQPIGYLNDWAVDFMGKYCRNKIVITVNFRNNKAFHKERNLDVDIWRQFFLSFQEMGNLTFILVCAREEIDDSLRDCSNVIFAKDFDTTIDQDLALISTADIHMGSSSGPATVAWFTRNKPYFIVRLTMNPSDFETPCLLNLGNGCYQFNFADPHQTFSSEPETLNLLTSKLREMVGVIEAKGTKKNYRTDATVIQNWLR